jgi:serine/threonine-protein kinase
MRSSKSTIAAPPQPIDLKEIKSPIETPRSTSLSPYDRLLMHWLEQFDRGNDIPIEELCHECPELAPSLESGVRALRLVAFMKLPPSDGRMGRPSRPAVTERFFPKPLAGRYRMERRIGKGGFGEVWRAFDLELQRLVAIKVPTTHPDRPVDECEFQNEARKVAKLKHQGIVPVYDVVRWEGMYFIVSDLVDGQDLAALLAQKQLTVREAVRIIAEAARSLQYAHDKGFIHRDIKPANILVDRRSNVYLTDFGIAATLEQLQKHGDDGRGTLAYMSPEQLHGDPSRIDGRSDLYSLGVVLYELLTRRHPFARKSRAALEECVLNQEPTAPRSLNRRIPREVERISMKCLAKSPVNRYASAAELANALTSSSRSRWRRRAMMLAAAMTLVLAGLIAGKQERQPAEGPMAEKKSVEPRAPENPKKPDSDLKYLPKAPLGPSDIVPAGPYSNILSEVIRFLNGKRHDALDESDRDIADLLIRERLLFKSAAGVLQEPRIHHLFLRATYSDLSNLERVIADRLILARLLVKSETGVLVEANPEAPHFFGIEDCVDSTPKKDAQHPPRN